MKPRELCEKAWQEIARNFPDFKVLGRGKTLRKIANNKDIIFEIYFQANRYNASLIKFAYLHGLEIIQ